MSRDHLAVLLFAAVFLIGACAMFGIDKVANYCQIVTTIPVAWIVYRDIKFEFHKWRGRK